MPPNADNSPLLPDGDSVLTVRGLKRHFSGVAAVDGVDLNVYPGEIYGFLGINGAGKTTTIRTLMGILAAEAGTITLMGETSKCVTVRQKQRIGYVSQEQFFYPWMSCAALGRFVSSFYPTWEQAEFERLLEVFNLPLKRRVGHLSGGMKAKLALALALAPQPDLLILDEPTAGLDPVARREFMEIIVAMVRERKRTTFFSSHLIDEVERCADRIGILHAGRMRFEGKLEELRGQVRQVVLPEEGTDFELSADFEVWKDTKRDGMRSLILMAPEEVWERDFSVLERVTHRLSLEEIFISCVSSKKEIS